MNPIAEEIKSYYGCGSDEEILEHYGIKRRSGRYPWGSGEDPFQHAPDFYNRVREYEKQGLSEQEICQIEGVNSKEFSLFFLYNFTSSNAPS